MYLIHQRENLMQVPRHQGYYSEKKVEVEKKTKSIFLVWFFLKKKSFEKRIKTMIVRINFFKRIHRLPNTRLRDIGKLFFQSIIYPKSQLLQQCDFKKKRRRLSRVPESPGTRWLTWYKEQHFRYLELKKNTVRIEGGGLFKSATKKKFFFFLKSKGDAQRRHCFGSNAKSIIILKTSSERIKAS